MEANTLVAVIFVLFVAVAVAIRQTAKNKQK